MTDEYRGDVGGGDGGVLLIVVVIVFLLIAAGGGTYYLTRQRMAAQQAEMRALEAERAAVAAALAARQQTAAASDVPQLFVGKVVVVAAPDEKPGAPPGDRLMALVADDGTTYALIEDDASRMFFVDARLRNRPLQLSALLIPGTQNLRLVRVRTVKDGQAYDVDYWCDNCAISAQEPGPCACCGEDIVLRERPVK